jgi:hypothetical protein
MQISFHFLCAYETNSRSERQAYEYSIVLINRCDTITFWTSPALWRLNASHGCFTTKWFFSTEKFPAELAFRMDERDWEGRLLTMIIVLASSHRTAVMLSMIDCLVSWYWKFLSCVWRLNSLVGFCLVCVLNCGVCVAKIFSSKMRLWFIIVICFQPHSLLAHVDVSSGTTMTWVYAASGMKFRYEVCMPFVSKRCRLNQFLLGSSIKGLCGFDYRLQVNILDVTYLQDVSR